MKKCFYAVFAGAAVLFAACAKEVETPSGNQEPEVVNTTPVYITAGIDRETTKSTLNNDTGKFGFCATDKIRIWDGTANTMMESIDGGVDPDDSNVSKATIAFPPEFHEADADGWYTAFPAFLVSDIDGEGVTFTFPTSYVYDDVGHGDPNVSSVPCPMIGTYTSGSNISYKQAAAVVRICLSNLTAGSLTFMFETPVTGSMKLTGVPTDKSATAGLVATNEGWTGKTITVTGTPTVLATEEIYITLPVPVGTAPQHIVVINECNSASGTRMAAIEGSAKPLIRTGGKKLSARPEAISHTFKVAADRSVVIAPGNLMAKISAYTAVESSGYGYATASEWKFGGYFEYIGGTKTSSGITPTLVPPATCTTGNDFFASAYNTAEDFAGALIGKWVDLFGFQGNSVATNFATNKCHGLYNSSSPDVDSWRGSTTGESLYTGCWNTKENNDPNAPGEGIYITNGGSYTWRPMTKDEWVYLLVGRASTGGGSTVGTFHNALHGRAKVAGVKGLLIFPDGITWRREEEGGSDCGSDALNAAMNAIAAKNKEEGVGYPKNLNINGKDTYDYEISYSAYEFVSMAQSGIVFLPAAGFRGGTSIQNVGTYGRYWSSASDPDEKKKAFNLSFDGTKVDPISSENRTNGRSVRLVRDVTL